jgi:hypothetical protein
MVAEPVPAVIDNELFAAVQEQLAENRQRNRQTRRGQRSLLQGLLVCWRCGYAYYGKAISPRAANGKRRDYAYYRCCGSDAIALAVSAGAPTRNCGAIVPIASPPKRRSSSCAAVLPGSSTAMPRV